MEGPKTYLMLK